MPQEMLKRLRIRRRRIAKQTTKGIAESHCAADNDAAQKNVRRELRRRPSGRRRGPQPSRPIDLTESITTTQGGRTPQPLARDETDAPWRSRWEPPVPPSGTPDDYGAFCEQRWAVSFQTSACDERQRDRVRA